MAKVSAKYEVLYIINPNLAEDETAALVEKFKAMVEAEGTLTSIEEWGKRKLAYPINLRMQARIACRARPRIQDHRRRHAFFDHRC